MRVQATASVETVSLRSERSGVRRAPNAERMCPVRLAEMRLACLDRDGRGNTIYSLTNGLVYVSAEYTDDAGRIIRLSADQGAEGLETAAMLLGWMLDEEWER